MREIGSYTDAALATLNDDFQFIGTNGTETLNVTFGVLREYIEKTSEFTGDSGWIDIIGTSLAGANISTPTFGQSIQYRKIGKTVFVQGNFRVNKQTESGNEIVCTLPIGFRSSKFFYHNNRATGKSNAAFNIETNGQIRLEWVCTQNSATGQTGDIGWVCIDLSYPV